MDAPLAYLDRIRSYYLALGYDTPYEWACFDDVPFTKPRKPLKEARLAIITTAAPFQPDKGDQGPGAAYNGKAKFFGVYSEKTDGVPDLRISHIAIDRTHTTAEDIGTYFPLRALKALAEAGEIGGLTRYFHGLPTDRSRRKTEHHSQDIVKRCLDDGADAAVLVPNCPVCHQSVTISAHALERAGIATVIMGCAKDIVEHVGAPRLLFSDFPLGNAAGRPNDWPGQLKTAHLAIDLLETATEPRTTRRSPLLWQGAPDWKKDYSNAALLSDAEIAARRKEFDRVKDEARQVKAAS